MVESQSLRGVEAAEPIWFEIKALERWVQRSQCVENQNLKGGVQRSGCSGASMVEKSKP